MGSQPIWTLMLFGVLSSSNFEIAAVLLHDCQGIPEVLLWVSCVISERRLLIAVGLRWDSYGIAPGFLWDCSMVIAV